MGKCGYGSQFYILNNRKYLQKTDYIDITGYIRMYAIIVCLPLIDYLILLENIRCRALNEVPEQKQEHAVTIQVAN